MQEESAEEIAGPFVSGVPCSRLDVGRGAIGFSSELVVLTGLD
jgi:hypothetical protein